MLSSTLLVDAADRSARSTRPHTIDVVDPAPDGTHLLALWHGRWELYPEGDTALLDRFMIDVLRAADAGAGHLAVGRYRAEDAVPRIGCPVLCVAHEQDPHSMRYHDAMVSALGAAEVRIADGRVALEHTAPEFRRRGRGVPGVATRCRAGGPGLSGHAHTSARSAAGPTDPCGDDREFGHAPPHADVPTAHIGHQARSAAPPADRSVRVPVASGRTVRQADRLA